MINLNPRRIDPLAKWRRIINANPNLALDALEQYRQSTFGFSPSVPELGWMMHAIKTGRVLAPPPRVINLHV